MVKVKTYIKNHSKLSLATFLIICLLTLAAFINSCILGDLVKIGLSLAALILYFVPLLTTTKFKINLPTLLEISYYLFIFASLVLGEVFAFYGPFPFWDVVLHFLSGFMLAGIGFSIMEISSHGKTKKTITLLFAFCFSITLGVAWECLEFSFDQIARTDAQKDSHVRQISTITMQRDGGNQPVRIDNINHTNIILENGEIITINEGYLDIGIMDTMKDNLINIAGAALFIIFSAISTNTTKSFVLTKKEER